MYFGVLLALGLRDRKRDPKTHNLFYQNPHPQRRHAADIAHPERVDVTVESDQSSTLLPLSDLKTRRPDVRKERRRSSPLQRQPRSAAAVRCCQRLLLFNRRCCDRPAAARLGGASPRSLRSQERQRLVVVASLRICGRGARCHR